MRSNFIKTLFVRHCVQSPAVGRAGSCKADSDFSPINRALDTQWQRTTAPLTIYGGACELNVSPATARQNLRVRGLILNTGARAKCKLHRLCPADKCENLCRFKRDDALGVVVSTRRCRNLHRASQRPPGFYIALYSSAPT